MTLKKYLLVSCMARATNSKNGKCLSPYEGATLLGLTDKARVIKGLVALYRPLDLLGSKKTTDQTR